MGWVRQHCDASNSVVVTANVELDDGLFKVLLAASNGAIFNDPTLYESTAAAFLVADALVRQRYPAHACSTACGAWIEEAS